MREEDREREVGREESAREGVMGGVGDTWGHVGDGEGGRGEALFF